MRWDGNSVICLHDGERGEEFGPAMLSMGQTPQTKGLVHMIFASLIIQVAAAVITLRYVRKLPALVFIFAAFGLIIVSIRLAEAIQFSDFAIFLTSITMLAGVTVTPHISLSVKQESKLLKSLEAVDRALLSSLSHKGLMNAIADRLGSTLGTDAAAILLTNGTVHTFASYGVDEEITRFAEEHAENGFIVSVVRSQKPLVISRINQDEDDALLNVIRRQGFMGFVCAPIVKRGTSVGVLVLFSKTPRPYTKREQSFIQAICNQIGIALNRAQLIERMQEMSFESVRSLVEAIEIRDPYTRGHSAQVAELAVCTAQKMDFNAKELKYIEYAGLLHDVGKIAVPEAILQKKIGLTEEEWEIIKKHPVFSAQVVEPILELRHIVNWIRHHHERWDGRGYPEGRSGSQIPLPSRILAVCDTYSAMTSDRPYRKALSDFNAIQELARVSGTQLDPAVVTVFLNVLKRRLSHSSIAGEHMRSTYPQDEKISYRPKGNWF